MLSLLSIHRTMSQLCVQEHHFALRCLSLLVRSSASLPDGPFFFPRVEVLSRIPFGMGYPLGQWESAVVAASPPNFLCTDVMRDRKCCTAATKTSLCYQRYFQHKSKMQLHVTTVKKIHSSPAKPSTLL